jgi:hypothetical protein
MGYFNYSYLVGFAALHIAEMWNFYMPSRQLPGRQTWRR